MTPCDLSNTMTDSTLATSRPRFRAYCSPGRSLMSSTALSSVARAIASASPGPKMLSGVTTTVGERSSCFRWRNSVAYGYSRATAPGSTGEDLLFDCCRDDDIEQIEAVGRNFGAVRQHPERRIQYRQDALCAGGHTPMGSTLAAAASDSRRSPKRRARPSISDARLDGPSRMPMPFSVRTCRN